MHETWQQKEYSWFSLQGHELSFLFSDLSDWPVCTVQCALCTHLLTVQHSSANKVFAALIGHIFSFMLTVDNVNVNVIALCTHLLT